MIETTHPTAAGAGHFAPIAGADTVMLTTYRKDGTPVGTPVHVVTDGHVARFRTFDPSGKLTRLRRNPDVEVAPCTVRGRVTGEAVPARARVLDGAEADAVARALTANHPFLHGRLIPWYHRRKGVVTTHVELVAR